MFSVAMSVYHKDDVKCFEMAMNSITDQQTVKPSEILLVVDGHVSDEMNDSISSFQRILSTLKVIRLPQNKGLGNALRVAVSHCKYELIARMDSDDIACPTRFEEQLKCFSRNPNLDIVGGNISEFIGTCDNVVGIRYVPTNNEAICKYMRYRNGMNHVTVMYRKDAVIKGGNYIDWFLNEDYYLWIRMIEQGCTFANTGTVLVNVRVGKDMYQRRGGWKYFMSGMRLQKYMLDQHVIGVGRFAVNVGKRFVVQVMLPNQIRGWVYQKFARRRAE